MIDLHPSKPIFEKYQLHDIINMEKTALFWKVESGKSFITAEKKKYFKKPQGFEISRDIVHRFYYGRCEATPHLHCQCS